MAGWRHRTVDTRGERPRRGCPRLCARGAAAAIPCPAERPGDLYGACRRGSGRACCHRRGARPRRHSATDRGRAGHSEGGKPRPSGDARGRMLYQRGAFHLHGPQVWRRRGHGMDRRPPRHNTAGRPLCGLPRHGRHGLHGHGRQEDYVGAARRHTRRAHHDSGVARLGARRHTAQAAAIGHCPPCPGRCGRRQRRAHRLASPLRSVEGGGAFRHGCA